jgi:carbonic anhydrase
MLPNLLKLEVRRVLCIVLVLAPALAANVARAQADATVAYGDRQSPIDIIDTPAHPVPFDPNAPAFGDTSALGKALTFTVKNTAWGPWCLKCTGSVDQRWASLKAYPPKDSAPHIIFGGRSYTLVDFHFHAPAEHLINGRLTEMEAHFVFNRDGTPTCSSDGLLVISQRITKGQENEELDKLFGPNVPLPTNSSPPYTTVNNFIVGRVLSGLPNSYRYAGSLTAPAELGCDNPPGNPNDQLASGHMPEVVSWVLLNDTIQMSEQQIARFQTLFTNGDARGPQVLKRQRVTKTFPSN